MSVLEHQCIVGKEAFGIFLSTLAPVGNSKEIWFKQGHNKFLVGEYNESGDFEISETKLSDPTDSTSRIKTTVHDNVWEYFSSQCAGSDGGLCYLPSQPQGLPLKAYVEVSDNISGCQSHDDNDCDFLYHLNAPNQNPKAVPT